MRKIHFIIFSMLLFYFLSSCVVESEEVNRQYQIVNNTSSQIIVSFFNRNSKEKLGVFIEKNQVYKGDLLIYRTGNTQLNELNSFYPSSAYKNSDSVKIVFNNSKIFTCFYTHISPTEVNFSNPFNKNLFRHGSYKKIGAEQYIFEITQQDYENAQPCNGNCE